MSANIVRVAKSIVRRIIGRPLVGRSILIYHRVAEVDFDPWNLAISPDEFERQLIGMRSKTVLPLQEFVRLHVRKQLPQQAIAITFDDGYACNALVAAPMLETFGYPATFFVSSEAIARSEEFWWDQLEFIFRGPQFDYQCAVSLLTSRSINGLSEAGFGHSLPPFFVLWRLVRDLSTDERRDYLIALRQRIGLEKKLAQATDP